MSSTSLSRMVSNSERWQRLLKPSIDSVYPLAEADKALSHIKQGGVVGKVVLKNG